MTTNTDATSGGGGGGLGSKIKGAAQVIHGFGENIRGSALGSADRMTGSKDGEKKHDEIATKGREEVAQGMAKVRGHPPQPAETTQETSTGAEPGAAAGTQAAGPGAIGQGQQKDKGDEASAGEGRSGGHSGPKTTENLSQQRSEQPPQQRADEQRATGQIYQETPKQEVGQQDEQRSTGQIYQETPKQEVGQQGDQKGLEKDVGGRMNFQGIPQDDEGAPH